MKVGRHRSVAIARNGKVDVFGNQTIKISLVENMSGNTQVRKIRTKAEKWKRDWRISVGGF